MANTPMLALPEIAESQNNKEVTHNESLRIIDALLNSRVISQTTTTQPTLNTSTDNGKIYIIPSGASGTPWSTYTVGDVAHWYAGAWYNYTPKNDWILFSDEYNCLIKWSGSAWVKYGSVHGKTYKTLTGNVTLTDDEESSNIIEVADGGGLSADFTVTTKTADEKFWVLYNATNYVMTFKTSGGSGQAVDPGKRTVVYCDGTNIVSAFTAATDGMIFRNTLGLPAYTVSSAPAASAANTGHIIYVSNGDAGAKCMAMSDGSAWKRISLGATISAT